MDILFSFYTYRNIENTMGASVPPILLDWHILLEVMPHRSLVHTGFQNPWSHHLCFTDQGSEVLYIPRKLLYSAGVHIHRHLIWSNVLCTVVHSHHGVGPHSSPAGCHTIAYMLPDITCPRPHSSTVSGWAAQSTQGLICAITLSLVTHAAY